MHLALRFFYRCFPVLALVILSTPREARGQLEALMWSQVPPVGSTAEFEDFQQISSIKEVRTLRISNVREERAGGVDYVWLEIESEIYDARIAEDRVPVISRFAIAKDKLREGKDFLNAVGDLVLQVDGKPPFRIPQALKEEMLQKGYLSGGLRGSGSFVDWTFEDLGDDMIEVPAGIFLCCHFAGIGKVKMSFPGGPEGTALIAAASELWVSDEVPFGLVKMILRLSGLGPGTSNVTNLVDSWETFTLLSYGRGARSKIIIKKQNAGNPQTVK
jgi:hypothetical protein